MKQEIIRIDLEGVNCYLLKAGDSFILADTGGHLTMDKQFTNRREKLINGLEMAGCKPGNLKLIILTHGDWDHAANAAFVREKYMAKIAMHSGDIESVENPVLEKVLETFHFKSIIYRIFFKLMKRPITRLTQKILADFEKFSPDIYLDEGDSLLEYGFDAKVLHIPGHTLGSIAILTKDGELISGDTFANMKKPTTAPNAFDFKTLYASVKRLKTMDIRMVYPGHGNPFEI
ncbi:MAG: MBL fold metallo-hydrolase [Ruminiclostridium sp.]